MIRLQNIRHISQVLGDVQGILFEFHFVFHESLVVINSQGFLSSQLLQVRMLESLLLRRFTVWCLRLTRTSLTLASSMGVLLFNINKYGHDFLGVSWGNNFLFLLNLLEDDLCDTWHFRQRPFPLLINFFASRVQLFLDCQWLSFGKFGRNFLFLQCLEGRFLLQFPFFQPQSQSVD